VRAGVGVVVLTGFPWTEYARLCGVHSSVPTFLWAGLRGVGSTCGAILLSEVLILPVLFLFSTCFVAITFLFGVE